MPKSKVTSRKAAKAASKTLRDSDSAKSKTGAGSALSQTKTPKKTTSQKAASKASSTIRDDRINKTGKSASGSALSQKTKSRGAKKK